MTTTSKRRAEIFDANYRANRVADALRYLDAALGCAFEAGLDLDSESATMRTDLTRQLERDAETAGFEASEFYSQE